MAVLHEWIGLTIAIHKEQLFAEGILNGFVCFHEVDCIVVEYTIHDLLGAHELPINEKVEEGETCEADKLPLADGDHSVHLSLSFLSYVIHYFFFSLIFESLFRTLLFFLFEVSLDVKKIRYFAKRVLGVLNFDLPLALRLRERQYFGISINKGC